MKKERPGRVTIAIKILLGALIFSLLMSVIPIHRGFDSYSDKERLLALNLQYASLFFVLVISLALIWFISRGHNWARIILLIFQLLGTFSLIPVIMNFNENVIMNLSSLIFYGIQCVALFLLFTAESKAWFKNG